MSVPYQGATVPGEASDGATSRRPHMVVCGDDALARRLADELRGVYRERVTLVAPPAGRARRAAGRGRTRAASLFGRVSVAMARAAGGGADEVPDRVVEAEEPGDEVLAEAGVAQASALALVYDDDELNIRAAMAARRLNPRLRLVIRLYNRRLGQHLAEVLDQAGVHARGGAGSAGGADGGGHALEATTTVLSDADTAAPALAASAVVGTSKVVQAEGLLLRAVEREPPNPGEVADPGLCTLALLSATSSDPAGSEGAEDSGDGPVLLPDEAAVAAATGRGIVALEAVDYAGPSLPRVRVPAFGSLLSRRLVWSLVGLAGCVVALAVAAMLVGVGDSPLHTTYVTLLDLLAINDPASDEPVSRQVLQLLGSLMGLLLLPVLLAAVLEALGHFRSATALRRPPRGLSGHLVLLGLGKIGTRVLTRLRDLDIPVVCVEEDPEARGIATARRLKVPVVVGDVTHDGVLEAAKIQRARALLALTSSDTTNLEAALYARSLHPDLRVVLRLYDDDLSAAVYRTLRAAHPRALTRSRSVSHLAAPAFAGAMMGRHVLGAIPVERRVLLFVALEVAGHPLLEGRTVADVFRPGAWRVLALDAADPDERVPDLANPSQAGASVTDPASQRPPGLVWDLHPGYVLGPRDRVVMAATRHGLAELLAAQRQQPAHRSWE